MTAPSDLYRHAAEVMAARTDPVGLLVAAAWAYDQAVRDLYERMVLDLARALGISERDARNRYPAPGAGREERR